ncbi:hypothetical protein [Streptomyces hydrogenans]|uniref:hypothetical protein n=1 Tax=Streptomyces hydrogenans TaxID=1873719 RepID=UPI0037FAB45D
MDQNTNGITEYQNLFSNLAAVADWTQRRRAVHADDASEYDIALAALQSLLRAEHIEGDGRWSAVRRARRVEKHVRAMRDAARAQEKAAEKLRTAFAEHVRHVTALPAEREAKREAKELRRANRRGLAAGAEAKALHKAAGPRAVPQAPPTPPTSQPARGVTDLWQRGA